MFVNVAVSEFVVVGFRKKIVNVTMGGVIIYLLIYSLCLSTGIFVSTPSTKSVASPVSMALSSPSVSK
jgi:hypothetical protein